MVTTMDPMQTQHHSRDPSPHHATTEVPIKPQDQASPLTTTLDGTQSTSAATTETTTTAEAAIPNASQSSHESLSSHGDSALNSSDDIDFDRKNDQVQDDSEGENDDDDDDEIVKGDPSKSYTLVTNARSDSVSTLGNMTYINELSDHSLKEPSDDKGDFYSTRYIIAEDSGEEEQEEYADLNDTGDFVEETVGSEDEIMEVTVDSNEDDMNGRSDHMPLSMTSFEETVNSKDEIIEIELAGSGLDLKKSTKPASVMSTCDAGMADESRETAATIDAVEEGSVNLEDCNNQNEQASATANTTPQPKENELNQSLRFQDIENVVVVVETNNSLDQSEHSVDWGDSFASLKMDGSQVFDEVQKSIRSLGGSQHTFMSGNDVAGKSTKAAATLRQAAFWGRDDEIDTLQRAFSSIATPNESSAPTPTIFWISGNDSGIGKTRLLNEFLQRLHSQPLVCSGRFDEKCNEKSFNGVVSCFSDMLNDLLQVENIQEWRPRIKDCLGQDMGLVTLHVPFLGILFDDENQKDPKILEKDDEKNPFERLKFALCQLLSIVCQHKDVIFALDNLQWADEGSIKLIESILTTVDSKRFFFVGCHRRLKVSHLVSRMKSRLPTGRMADIKLQNLDAQAAKSIIAYNVGCLEKVHGGSLHLSLPDTLAPLWKGDCSGNPLYLTHLVHHLHEKQILRLENRSWILDEHYTTPSSPALLISERINSITEDERLVLKSVALLDLKSFTCKDLSVALATLSRHEKLQTELSGEGFKEVLDGLAKKAFLTKTEEDRYFFVDDVIREVALTTISGAAKRRKRLHARLALNLLQCQSEEDEESCVAGDTDLSLLIAHHFCEGNGSLSSGQEKITAAKYCFQVAERCAVAAAYVDASRILHTSLALLDNKTQWKDTYQLALKIHLAIGRSLLHGGDLDKAKSYANIIIANGRTPRDKVGGFHLLASVCCFKGQYDLAKNIILKALGEIWGDNPSAASVEQKLSELRALAQAKSDMDLLILDEMSHRKTLAKMPFLMKLVVVCGLCQDLKLQDQTVLRIVELTIRYGSFAPSFTGFAFALFGNCVGRRRLHAEAYRYGHLADMMSNAESSYGRQAITIHHSRLRFWKASIHDSPKVLHEVCTQSLRVGDTAHLASQIEAYLSTTFIAGQSLDIDDRLLDMFSEKCDDLTVSNGWKAFLPYNSIMRLKGGHENNVTGCLSGTKEIQHELFHQMITAVFFQDMEGAATLCTKLFTRPDGVWIPFGAFIEGILSAHMTRSCSGEEKTIHQKKATNLMDLFSLWTRKGVQCVGVMSEVLRAEVTLAVEANVTPQKAAILFETAIQSASTVPSIAALACERAGLYFISQNDNKAASRFLSRSSQFYSAWGASAKVKQLNDEYRNFLIVKPESPQTFTKCSTRSLVSLSKSQSNHEEADFMRPQLIRGSSERIAMGITPGLLRTQFQRGISERIVTSNVNMPSSQFVNGGPAQTFASQATFNHSFSQLPGFDGQMHQADRGLPSTMPGPPQHAGWPLSYSHLNFHYQQPPQQHFPVQRGFHIQPQQYSTAGHHQIQQQYQFGRQLQQTPLQLQYMHQSQPFYAPQGYPEQIPQQQPLSYFQQQNNHALYHQHPIPPQSSQSLPQQDPAIQTDMQMQAFQHKNAPTLSDPFLNPPQSPNAKKTKRLHRLQEKSNSVPKALRLQEVGDPEDPKAKKGKHKGKIGQTMSELKQDLNPREFLKDMHIGTKKMKDQPATKKTGSTNGGVVPRQTPLAQKSRPTLSRLSSWATRSWSGGKQPKDDEKEPDKQQPRRKLKGQQINSKTDTNEATSISPLNKKASVKSSEKNVTESGPPKTPKKKKSSVNRASVPNSSNGSVLKPPESPKKKNSLTNKAPVTQSKNKDTSSLPISPKKKKNAVKPAPIIDSNNAGPVATSKKAPKKKKNTQKGDTEEKVDANEKPSSAKASTNGEKKKGGKKKEGEMKNSVTKALKGDKNPTQKNTNGGKKAKKQKQDLQ